MENLFNTVYNESIELGDDNCCSVIALSILTGKSYKEIYKDFENEGRVFRKGSNFLSILSVTRKYFSVVEVTSKIRKVAKTTRALNRIGINNNFKLLVFVSGHVCAFTNGKIQDWTDERLNRITRVFLLEEK